MGVGGALQAGEVAFYVGEVDRALAHRGFGDYFVFVHLVLLEQRVGVFFPDLPDYVESDVVFAVVCGCLVEAL